MGHKYTAPLLADDAGLPVYSHGYALIEVVEKYWKVKGLPLRLDEWQKHLLIRILEQCPPGHARAGQLRYRQVVVSIPRQAGKSLLAAVLSLYGLLMHSPAPKVLGVARGVEQAKIVYGYTHDAISASPVLKKLFRQTETRGITKTKGLGSYKVLPAKPESIQGYESTLSIVDELHVLDPRIWDAIVESQRAQKNPLLVGITTAGDISSVLLKRLYEQGDAAVAGAQETFGFFVYEASSDELTLEAITEANPAVAAGRIDAQTILDDCKGQPPSQWKRFTLNVFVEGLAEPWVPVSAWAACAGTGLEDFSNAYFSFEVHGNYDAVSIIAAKLVDGTVKTCLIARLIKPSPEKLQAWAERIKAMGKCTFVMDGYRKTKTLANWIDDKGWSLIRIGNGGSRVEAASMTYASVMRHQLEHDSQPMVNAHHARARMKNDTVTGTEVDLAIATIYAVYAALTHKERRAVIA